MPNAAAKPSQRTVGDAFVQRINAVLGGQRRKYTVDRLRSLYADLLQLIDVANDDLGRRSLGDTEKLDSAGKGGIVEAYINFFQRPLGLVRGYRTESNASTSAPPRRDLAAAFRVLAATPSAQKEGSNGGAVAVRDNYAVSSLSMARARESRVVELIRCIGEVVVYGEQRAGEGKRASIRSDAVFEYFCEKSMLSLLVDISKSKPQPPSENGDASIPSFHAVTWTPLVKAQVLQTISILVSNVQDPTSLYYLLSNNHVNELVRCMLPMRQWTDPALEEMMPVYVSFLKTLALKLASSPNLFPFLKKDDPKLGSTSFPLFSAALEVATGSFAQSDSFVHVTCLNLLVNVLQISHPSIRSWVSVAESEHKQLAEHLCQRLLDRYRSLAQLTTGTVVDLVRSSAIVGQLTNLRDQFEFLNDVLWCGVRALNVRICESLLQRVVFRLLQNLIPQNKTRRLAVGMSDDDIIPESEALAHASALFLSQFFLSLEYKPFLRMLAVAILHSESPKQWRNCSTLTASASDDYVLTPALNNIAQRSCTTADGSTDTVDNPFQQELLAVLRGDEGDWRFIPVAMLLESVLESDALDLGALTSLNVIPCFSDRRRYPPSPWENALSDFLNKRHVQSSTVSTMALEGGGSLALSMLSRVVASITTGAECFDELFRSSPLVRGVGTARSNFCANAQNLQEAAGVSDLFVDLVELAIKSRYNVRCANDNEMSGGTKVYACSLSKFAFTAHSRSPAVLVRKFRNVSSNDVEDARFALRMALHFRAICNTVEDLHGDLSSDLGPSVTSPRWSQHRLQFDTDDVADELLLTIGGLKEKPALGTDLDLRGRTTFRFFTTAHRPEQIKPAGRDVENERKRKFSEDILRPCSTELVLVLDPTDIFVVKPAVKEENDRGTILCSTSLSSVIAFAPDGEWLHIAIRHMEDIGYLVKNGNMALRFDSAGTCLVVRQYLERARLVLQRDLEQRIQLLFSEGNHQDSLFYSKNGHSDADLNGEEELSGFLGDRPASTGSPTESNDDKSNEKCLV